MTQANADHAHWHQEGAGCWRLQADSARTAWIFGLRWLPTAGQKSRKLLLRQLYREQVRWWNTPATRASTVGFLPPDVQPGRAQPPLCSAASRFAQVHAQGSHLLRLQLERQRYWLVAVHQGNVLCQTDCWLESREAADAMEAEIRDRFAQLQVNHLDWNSEEDRIRFLALLDGDNAHISVILRRLRPGVPRTLPLLLTVVVALLILWWMTSEDVATGSAAGSGGPRAQAQPAAAPPVWITAPDALSRVAHTWAALPVEAAGWSLRTVRCVLERQQAFCQAAYARVERQAVNDDLRTLADDTWVLQPVSLDHTELLEHVVLPQAHVLRPGERGTASEWLQSLQKLSSKVFHVDMGAAQSQGVRSLEISLPLDRLDQVQALALPVRWQRMTLEVLPEHAWMSMGTRLQVFLTGELTGED